MRVEPWKDRAFALASGLWTACCLPLAFSGRELFAGGWTEPFALLGLVPLISRLRRVEAKRAFRLGWLAGLVYFGLTLAWLDVALTTFGHLPRIVGLPVLLLLVAFLALFWALPCWAAVRLRARNGLALHIGLPVLWVAAEFARNYVLTGFPWSGLGTLQVRTLWLAQLASLGGVYLVAFAVVAVNAWVERLWAGLRAGPLVYASLGRDRRVLIVGLLGLSLAAGWGAWRLNMPLEGEPLSAAVVQGNLDERVGLRGLADQRWVMRRMLEASRRAVARGAKLVVWPEGTLPAAVHPEARSLASILPRGQRAGFELEAELVIGGLGRGQSGGRDLMTNSAFLTDGRLQVRARYDKRHLVPFGEVVPLGWLLPWEWFVPEGVRFFDPGMSHAALSMDVARLGMLICYEAIFPEIARESVGDGAELLVNITNDSWYGPSSAPYQHLAISRMRAIETGRFQVRAANTGLSALIDSRGRVLAETELGLVPEDIERPGRSDLKPPVFLVGQVLLSAERTPYVLLGDLFAWVCTLLSLLWLAPGFWRRLTRRK